MIGHCSSGSSRSFHEKSWIGTHNHPMMYWPLSSSGTGSLCVKEVGCEEHPRWSSRVVNPTCNERLCWSAREWEQRGQVKTSNDCLESLVDRQWRTRDGEMTASANREKQTYTPARSCYVCHLQMSLQWPDGATSRLRQKKD